jgi:hypothetical protein
MDESGYADQAITEYGYILLGDEELRMGVKVISTCSGRIYNIGL